MSGEPENLTLELLRSLRDGQDRMEKRLEGLAASMAGGFSATQDEIEQVEGRINGLLLMMGNFATNLHDIGERIEHLERRDG